MKIEQKFRLLEKFLNKFGFSLDEEPFKEFLLKNRMNVEDLKKQNAQSRMTYGPIEPTIHRITPLSFHNCGYFGGENDFTCLREWLAYENLEGNDLVFENLGKDQIGLKESFERTRKLDGPAFADDEGHLFNGTDGNHRLLSLMINEFVEYESAKTESEKKAVLQKYAMEIPVSYPHDRELCELLEKERSDFAPYESTENETTRIPLPVREYRALHQKGPELYVAKYDHQTETYTYDFNGTKFSGSCAELVRFLKTKQKETRPIMLWDDGETYYVSNNNTVFKSKIPSRVQARFDEMKMKVRDDAKLKPYLVVYDADTGLYEIKTSQLTIQESDLAVRKDILNLGLAFTEHSANKPFFEILGLDRNKVMKELEDARDFGFVASFGPLHLENLTQKEAFFVQSKLDEINGYISKKVSLVNDSDNFKDFSEQLFKIMPRVNETNRLLLGVSCGLVKNPRIKEGEGSEAVVSAKRSLELGRLVPMWGMGRVSDKYKVFGEMTDDFKTLPEFHVDSKTAEIGQKLEEIFSDKKKAFTEANLDYIRVQIVNLEDQINQLQYLKKLTRDVEMKRHLEDMINVLEENLTKCEDMCQVFLSRLSGSGQPGDE